jgi:hypothetical protein
MENPWPMALQTWNFFAVHVGMIPPNITIVWLWKCLEAPFPGLRNSVDARAKSPV